MMARWKVTIEVEVEDESAVTATMRALGLLGDWANRVTFANGWDGTFPFRCKAEKIEEERGGGE